MTLSTNNHQLAATGAEWKPDIVLVYQASNDLSAMVKNGLRAAENEWVIKESITSPRGLPSLVGPIQEWIEQCSLYELIKANATARLNGARILDTDVPDAYASQFFSDLHRLESSAEAIDAKFAVCTFAFSHAGELNTLPDDYRLILLKTIPDLAPVAWSKCFDRWNHQLRDQKDTFVVLDVAKFARGETELFRDPVHFSELGHQAVGEFLAESIVGHPSLLDGVVVEDWEPKQR
ncbi:hypothetical protein [Rhodopirellula sallentina]|uniref:SGNH hydrolase-type esterase domain-containing protein n=1 Tax=Rhodopirellula sallentina SM41 TaxID=1263870 RepID=M5U622_9BACT|nr:hypothetical protein [Rhodopirellula sallentina]EMI56917.1 hypothetical protein RSSM_01598 [Rhodopirellula sallentina SM41]